MFRKILGGEYKLSLNNHNHTMKKGGVIYG